MNNPSENNMDALNENSVNQSNENTVDMGNAPFIKEDLAKIASDHGMAVNHVEKQDHEIEGGIEESVMPMSSRELQIFDLREDTVDSNAVLPRILSNEELERIYQKSIRADKKEQPVRGELYSGKNPSLVKFVKDVLHRVIPKLNATYENRNIVNTQPIDTDFEEEVVTLHPESIFDDGFDNSLMESTDNTVQSRGSSL